MANRKHHYTVRSFEGIGTTFTDDNGKKLADTSANIYESMLRSKAFRSLKNRQKVLYLICKSQYYGKRKPKADYKEDDRVQDDTCFYLNLDLVCQYGLYTKNMRKEFYGDMKELRNKGFIEQVASGRGTMTKSIYRFASGWKQWEEN